jgi:LysM repeat protein
MGRYLAPAALAGLVAAIAVVIVTFPGRAGVPRRPGKPPQVVRRELPPYWTVRRGDTYAEISAKTGLTVAQLEAFNPNVDPLTLPPGRRLNLWRYPPKPRPKPPAPRFWTVRRGESFGSIAAKTGINVITLEQLNSRLKPTTLQAGDRVRLRR